ncbi:Zinc finger CCHC domain-containing protein 8 [Larimichthys crocea]|uniref:Uncharacterized protein n=1 Tax=Larimichthys crocea TaxID=215358 RepID=A0ACD3Q8J3_LARCR|nr:Zinc finger CCHC domain-containing protein 8 [Larimichthys crocea]
MLTLPPTVTVRRLHWEHLPGTPAPGTPAPGTPAPGTPAPSSPSVSTPAHVDTEPEEVEEAMDTTKPAETCQSSENKKEPGIQEICSQASEPMKVEDDSPQSPEPVKTQNDTTMSPGPIKAQDDSPQSPGPIKAQDDSPLSPGPIKAQDDSPQSPGPIKAQDDSPQSPGPIKCQEDNPQSPVEKISAVPHRSNFAAGIVPFEDTPEFTEVAEATGTYLKIRDLLKSSPRNLAKKK